jgi:hypothetical protein
MLTTSKVIVGEGWGRIQIEGTHKPIQSGDWNYSVPIAISSSLLAIESSRPDPLPNRSMDCVHSDSEAIPKSVSLIPVVSNRQGSENLGREIRRTASKDRDRLAKEDEFLGSLEFGFTTF